MTVFIGVDPASATGAVGVLSSEGDFLDCYMIQHQVMSWHMSLDILLV